MSFNLDEYLKGLLKDQFKKAQLENTPAQELEGDWDKWLRVVFADQELAEFSDHHKIFWDWCWSIERDVDHLSMVLCLPRGHGKSSCSEMAAAALLSRDKRDFALLVCATQEKANEHLSNIAALLEGAGVQKHYPELGKPRMGLYGNRKGWNKTELRTDSGKMIKAVGLDVPVRGIKDGRRRPNLFIFDDLDALRDTPEATAGRLLTIQNDILPARGKYAVSIFAQNLIHRNSIMSKIMDQKTGLLSTAIKIGPIKAFEDLTYEEDPGGNPDRVVLTGGRPTWDYFDLESAQIDIDTYGWSSFRTECQQEIGAALEGAIYPIWDEKIHIITWSEFAAYYGPPAFDQDGKPRIPLDWDLMWAQDWGQTYAHPAVSLWFAKPSEAPVYGFDGLEDCYFCYREFHAPRTPQEEKDGIWDAVAIGNHILDLESENNENRRIGMDRVMSHEAKTARLIYANQLKKPLVSGIVNPTITYGIDSVRILLTPDKSRPHPFRKFPKNYPHLAEDGTPLAGKPLQGRPRLFYIVDDDQGGLFWDEVRKELRVMPPVNNRGFWRMRWEKPQYHWLTNLAGEEKQRPYSLNQDAQDAERYRIGSLGGIIQRQPPLVRAKKEWREREKDLTQEFNTSESEFNSGDLSGLERQMFENSRTVEMNRILSRVLTKPNTKGSTASSRQRMRRLC